MKHLRIPACLFLALALLLGAMAIPAAAENIAEVEIPAETLAIGTAGTWDSCDVLVEGTLRYDYAFQVLEIENQRRVSLGLDPLVMDRDLMDHAMNRAMQCALYWSHTQPDGASFGYGSAVYLNAEIIAKIYTTPQAAVNGWYNSSSHYPEIIGKNYTGTGVGVFEIGGVYYWVQVFNMKTPTTASASDYPASKTASRTVHVAKDNIGTYASVSLSDRDLAPGETARFSVKYARTVSSTAVSYALPASGLRYESSDESVCTVSADGVVSANAGGTATLRAWYPGYESGAWSFTVTVSGPAHQCSYTGEVTTTPGCETAGEMTYTCSCGKHYTEPIDPTGHDLDGGTVTTEPGCLSFGVLTFTCKTCGHTETAPIAPGSHAYTSVVSRLPTATRSGTLRKTCSVCGKTVVVTLPLKMGDVSPDGVVDETDLTALMELLAGTGSGNPAAADVTGDGVTDVLDLIRLMRYLSGEDVTLG